MKKYTLLFSVIICTLVLSAQDPKPVFGAPTVVWYGMDFTKAKMIGLKDESPHTIRDTYFKDWNGITVNMDLGPTFHKTTVAKDIKGVSHNNNNRETDALLADADVDFTKEQIAEQVKALPAGEQRKGLAVVFIVQSFNKTTETATVHVVYFDIASRVVLWSKKVTAKSGSGNTSKAWTTALKTILTNIEKRDYNAWKKEANY
jgi:hypothetical protein